MELLYCEGCGDILHDPSGGSQAGPRRFLCDRCRTGAAVPAPSAGAGAAGGSDSLFLDASPLEIVEGGDEEPLKLLDGDGREADAINAESPLRLVEPETGDAKSSAETRSYRCKKCQRTLSVEHSRGRSRVTCPFCEGSAIVSEERRASGAHGHGLLETTWLGDIDPDAAPSPEAAKSPAATNAGAGAGGGPAANPTTAIVERVPTVANASGNVDPAGIFGAPLRKKNSDGSSRVPARPSMGSPSQRPLQTPFGSVGQVKPSPAKKFDGPPGPPAAHRSVAEPLPALEPSPRTRSVRSIDELAFDDMPRPRPRGGSEQRSRPGPGPAPAAPHSHSPTDPAAKGGSSRAQRTGSRRSVGPAGAPNAKGSPRPSAPSFRTSGARSGSFALPRSGNPRQAPEIGAPPAHGAAGGILSAGTGAPVLSAPHSSRTAMGIGSRRTPKWKLFLGRGAAVLLIALLVVAPVLAVASLHGFTAAGEKPHARRAPASRLFDALGSLAARGFGRVLSTRDDVSPKR